MEPKGSLMCSQKVALGHILSLLNPVHILFKILLILFFHLCLDLKWSLAVSDSKSECIKSTKLVLSFFTWSRGEDGNCPSTYLTSQISEQMLMKCGIAI